ncbi:protein glxC [Pleurocapsales cyanobacterium LEGE 10410]|nr:protein glxC [Pleurocapsales cyanobacterium LEGE 10410]
MQQPTVLKETVIDCEGLSTQEINQRVKALAAEGIERVKLLNPAGKHNLAVGIVEPIEIEIIGSAGYYCGGLSSGLNLEVLGNCSWSLGENLMDGQIIVRGNASANAGATASGGRISILGNAGARAGISLKGGTLIVAGNVGYGSAFMMQQGRIVICGDAGDNLADSIYEGAIYVGGNIASLGADAKLEPMTAQDWQFLETELNSLEINFAEYDFKKIVSAKELHHFKAQDWFKFKDAY